MRSRRRYQRGTLILETEFTTADGGAVVVIDFMPLRESGPGPNSCVSSSVSAALCRCARS